MGKYSLARCLLWCKTVLKSLQLLHSLHFPWVFWRPSLSSYIWDAQLALPSTILNLNLATQCRCPHGWQGLKLPPRDYIGMELEAGLEPRSSVWDPGILMAVPNICPKLTFSFHFPWTLWKFHHKEWWSCFHIWTVPGLERENFAETALVKRNFLVVFHWFLLQGRTLRKIDANGHRLNLLFSKTKKPEIVKM